MGTFLGVPIIRIIIYWGLYWGPLILRNYHMKGECTLSGGGSCSGLHIMVIDFISLILEQPPSLHIEYAP